MANVGMVVWMIVGLGACGDVMSEGDDDDDVVVPPDGPEPVPTCAFDAPFGAPVPIAELATPAYEQTIRLSSDELTAFFQILDPTRDFELYVAKRATRAEPFEPPVAIAQLNSTGPDTDPAISADGRTLWFSSTRTPGEGSHLYFAIRPTSDDDFSSAGLVSELNAGDVAQSDLQPFITADGNEAWFVSTRAPNVGGFDIWRAVRHDDVFSAPVPVGELDSAAHDWFPLLAADGLTVYLSSLRSGGTGDFDVWRAHRASTTAAFSAPVPVAELNTTADDRATWLSSDGCRIYGNTGGDIWMATRPPM